MDGLVMQVFRQPTSTAAATSTDNRYLLLQSYCLPTLYASILWWSRDNPCSPWTPPSITHWPAV